MRHTNRVKANHSMKNILSVLAIVAASVMPASAETFEVMNPDELMVLVPNVEFVGYSRISTVEFCAQLNNIQDWTDMGTDEELYSMEGCLIEHN